MFALVILFVIGTGAIINPYGPTVVNDYTNCLVQLMDVDFNSSGLLIFADTNSGSSSVIRIRSELLKHIHKSMKYSVQIVSPGNEVAICSNHDKNDVLHNFDAFEAVLLADYFVVIIDNYFDFTFLASKLIRSRSWNPQAKFIILLLNFDSNNKPNVKHVENILTCLFRYNVLNIVIIIPQANKIRNAFIYSWKPYDPPRYCGYYNETATNRLIIENVCEKGYVKHKKGLFENRIPTNMTGCILHILALERQPFVSADECDPNIEKKLVDEVLKTFNFKPQYEVISSFRGERDSGQWSGAIEQLISRRGNVLLGGIFPDNDVHEDFESSSSYLSDSYVWVVPRAHPSPRWLPLIIIFTKQLWGLVIVAFVICALVWRILGQLSRDTIRNKTFIHCFLSTWICTMGFCTYLRPKKESLRVFFVFLNLYCIMCLTGYQTKLIDVLRNPTYDHQINTIEEIVQSGLKFGGFEELHDLFYNSSDPLDYQLGEKWTDVEDISQALIDVAVHRNFSLLCSRLELAHTSASMPEISDGYGNYKYYAFKTNVFSVPIEMVAMKGFAYMREFSNTLAILKQAGVNSVIRRYFAAMNMRRRAKLLRSLDWKESDVNPLSLQHLQGGFLALVFGHVLGTVVFFVEIVINSTFMINQITQLKKSLKKE